MKWITVFITAVVFLPHFVTGLDLQQCMSNVIEVDETSSSNVVTCRRAGQNEDIRWRYTASNGVTVLLSTCTPSGSCGTNSFFTATRSPSSTFSQLTFKLDIKTHRSDYGSLTLSCETSSQGPVSCQLDVVHRASVTSCSAQFNTSGTQWTVSGTCDVSKTYSERGRYSCTWTEHRAGSSTPIPASQTSLTKTPYTEGGATYNSVTCSFNRPFPTVTGTYTYSVIISPGSVTPAVSGSNTILAPAQPSTDCPAGFIKQGDTLRCTCSTTNPGTPPATVTWVGQSGAQLEVTGVTSSDNNKQYTCQVRWGNSVILNTTYTLRVAYGPSTVSVSGPNLPFDTDGRQEMTLHCTVSASTYNPSLTYAWRHLPSNTVVSTTSSFTFTVTPQDDGKQIQCTASNSQYSELQSHDTFTLNVNYPPTAAPTIANYNNDILYAWDTLNLTCTVRGGKPVVRQVSFICDDKPDGSDVIKQDDVSSSVTFTRLVPANDGDDCTCSADWKTYGWYTLTAHRRLVVYYKPSSPDIQAADGTSYPFIAGETTNASLVCESSDHGNPAASYTWPHTGGGHTWTDSQGRGRLTFDLLTPSHNGVQVTCHASNNYTEHKQDPVVDGSFHLQVYYHPIISLDPRADSNKCDLTSDRRSCEVTEGHRVDINCTSHSNPSPASAVWTKDGSNVGSGSMLTVNVTNHTVHTGQYSCHVTTNILTGHPGRRQLTATYHLTVFVMYRTVRNHLTVNSQPHTLTVNESDNVYMECRADGRPTPKIRLVNTDSGQEKNYTDGGHVTLEDRDSRLTYTLYQADCRDAGTYRCTAGNDVNTDITTDEVTLFVKCKPRVDNSDTLPSANYKGTPVMLPIEVVAYPVPDTFHFTYLGSIDSGVGNVTDVSDIPLTIGCRATQSVYLATCVITIDTMTQSDAGVYNVRMGNTYGHGDVRFRVLFNETEAHQTPGGDKDKQDGGGGGLSNGATIAVCIAVFAVIVTAFMVWVWRRQWILPCADRSVATRLSDDVSRGQSFGMEATEVNTGADTDSLNQVPSVYEELKMREVGLTSPYSSLQSSDVRSGQEKDHVYENNTCRPTASDNVDRP